uniref:Origin recognition complex subunit 6 n=1 Tax=Lygus hesperus TaxID=30085 RepID=A0A146LTP2_LYGHE
MSDQMLRTIAEKLNLHSTKAVQKASEYYRLCSAKSTLGLSKISDTAKICVVLHIASEELSLSLDKSRAIKLSCLTKPSYLKLVHTYKSLLNGGSTVTISSLCADLGIPELAQTARELLDKYTNSQIKGSVDAEQPMYACAAVLATTKLKRATVDKNHLKENCRVKWATVQKLSGEMAELGRSSREGRKRKVGGPDSSAIAAAIEKKSTAFSNASEETRNDKTEQDPEDEYQSWKRRILEQANS